MSNRAWLYPATAERDYMRELLRLNKEIQTATMEALNNQHMLRTDAWSDELSAMFLYLLSLFMKPGEFRVARLRDTYTAISQFNDRQWRLQVKAGTGIEIGPSSAGGQRDLFTPNAEDKPLGRSKENVRGGSNQNPSQGGGSSAPPSGGGGRNGNGGQGGGLPPGARAALGSTSDPNSVRAVFGMGVDVYREEPWLVPLRDNWIADNVRLIKTIPEQSLSQVEGVIRRGVAQGLAPSEIQKQIKEQFGVSDRRAKVIARDQISKANAALTEHRQKDLGVESYTWMSSDDARVRPTHKQTDGQVYEWSKPPTITGGRHPGQEILCRCWARPVFRD